MQSSTIKMTPKQLLQVANHSLTKCFFEDSRSDAKKLFKILNNGGEIDLVKINTEQGNTIVCFLQLEQNDFVGKLKFDTFTSALASTLQHTADKLNQDADLNILQDEFKGDMIFHIPGVVKMDDQMNVMVIGLESKARGILVYKLHFLDPSQYDL